MRKVPVGKVREIIKNHTQSNASESLSKTRGCHQTSWCTRDKKVLKSSTARLLLM